MKNTHNSLVAVPPLNNETIQATLEINKTLIKILIELQNNGWIREGLPYQNRLQTNLAYLATVADYAMRHDNSKPLPEAPDLSPVPWPKILEQSVTDDIIQDQARENAIAAIKPPPMVVDRANLTSEQPRNLNQAPPFVMPNQIKQAAPQGVDFRNEEYASEKTAEFAMLKRLESVAVDQNPNSKPLGQSDDEVGDADYRPSDEEASFQIPGTDAAPPANTAAPIQGTGKSDELDYFNFFQ